jgi:hypothetical protein
MGFYLLVLVAGGLLAGAAWGHAAYRAGRVIPQCLKLMLFVLELFPDVS